MRSWFATLVNGPHWSECLFLNRCLILSWPWTRIKSRKLLEYVNSLLFIYYQHGRYIRIHSRCLFQIYKIHQKIPPCCRRPFGLQSVWRVACISKFYLLTKTMLSLHGVSRLRDHQTTDGYNYLSLFMCSFWRCKFSVLLSMRRSFSALLSGRYAFEVV